MQSEKYFFEDDGSIPNNELPLLRYRDAFKQRGSEGAAWLEKRFAENNWTNSWRNGVFGYHHYHSNTHEVLGVYSGNAEIQLGGEHGKCVELRAGDIIVIPAGVAHKNNGSSSDFGVVGAYPDGSGYDLKTEKNSDYAEAKRNIKQVPVPGTDPLLGKAKGVPIVWNDLQD